jgi:immune inhibitor A
MSPEAREKLNKAMEKARAAGGFPYALSLRASEPRALGFNDGVIVPPNAFPLGTSPSVIRSAGADRAPLQGTLRVIVVLVDFSDKQMVQTQQHFRDLFFSQGGPKKSVRDYYAEVTNGLVDIQGDVVGPFRLPQTLATYAHNASGIGAATPNAQTMARDAAVAANPTVNFTPYDNDGNGYVDAFIVIHAGTGAETNSNPGDIWSHKWTLDGGQMTVDTTKIFAYLTVPEDCKIGVCAHELGHLLFGFPDLYDTDGSSEGIGNWCLMASGSWGGGGDAPTHPSAWCKANQGWVQVDNRTTNGVVQIPDVKASHTVYRLWKDGAPGKEYFLVENRQKTGSFDVSLPGSGMLIWHIDENVTNNRDENHYWVALMQADGKRDLELNHNRGDAGDCWPGSASNTNFTNTSTPNSKSYAGAETCVAVTGISAAAATMTANLQVKCGIKPKKEIIKEKEFRKDMAKELAVDKRLSVEKPLAAEKRPDKTWVEGKVTDNKFNDGKFSEGKFAEGRPGGFGQNPSTPSIEDLLARIAALESAVGGGRPSGDSGAGPFIGNELRPDLSQGALSGEEDAALNQQMAGGSAHAKRFYDSGNT